MSDEPESGAAGAERAVEAGARRDLVRAGRRLHEDGLVGGRAGNLSARLPDGRILVTPTGAHKGRLGTRDLLVLDLDEPDAAARARATSELPMHRNAYRAAEEIGAVVHSHAPALTAVGLRDLEIGERLPEIQEAVGRLLRVPFLPGGSAELGRAVGRAVARGGRLLLLERHGALAVGRTVSGALDRTELGELAAYAVLLAEGAGLELDLEPVLRLHRKRAAGSGGP